MQKWLIAIACIFIVVDQSSAGIVITGTRIIYPSSKEFVSVQIDNTGEEQALVQAWIDHENEAVDLSGIKAPFIVTPPLKTVDPNKGQALRIIYNHKEQLPKDRESLFWFNLLDIPAKPENLQNYIQFAVRSRLKLLFRPNEIKMSQTEAFKQLGVKIENNHYVLDNPTPYYINFGKKTAYLKDGTRDSLDDFRYMEPFSKKILTHLKNESLDKIEISIINDYGAVYDFNKNF